MNELECYNKERICPICNKQMVEFERPLATCAIRCNNRCFQICTSEYSFLVKIFKRELYITRHERSEKTYKERMKYINKTIAYWKENDRYLMKIMEGV